MEQMVIRPARAADLPQLVGLSRLHDYHHRHLDWRQPLDWLGSMPFFLLEENGRIAAALACPPDPPGVAWLRLFVCSREVSMPLCWQELWKEAAAALADSDCLAAVIIQHDWLMPLLRHSGFSYRQDIIMFELSLDKLVMEMPLSQAFIRPMRREDLPAVAEVDAAAFDILWRNSLDLLRLGFSQAAWADVAVSDQGIVGYQISTRNPVGGHLARLAVHPEVQHHGLGHALVENLAGRMKAQGLNRLTLNTQSDNLISQSLYHKIGFQETGERFPVYDCVL